MGGVWHEWGAVLLTCALALPVGVALAVFRPRTAVAVGIFAGTAPWVWMVLTPKGHGRAVSAVPLRDLITVLGADPTTVVVQVGANLLMFAALGFLLPVRSASFAGHAGLCRVAAVAAVASTTLEAAQWVLAIGRVSSVDDVLLNTAGAVVAAAISPRRWIGRHAAPAPGQAGPGRPAREMG
ncbi:VanZ family protein [Streptomyces sp. SID3343]|uniref:VanZ family protein n=1 Tax=Streptomyces sp. SID3343 TaxID=2690260 RepID=UPI0031F7D2DC